MQIVQCSTCPICRSVMSNSKAYILRNRLAPDILDNIECHIRPHSLLTIKHAAQLLLAGCLDELGQRIEISDWHCDDSAMAIYGRLLWRIDLDSIVVYLLLCLLLFLNYSLFYYFIILFYFILFYFIYFYLFLFIYFYLFILFFFYFFLYFTWWTSQRHFCYYFLGTFFTSMRGPSSFQNWCDSKSVVRQHIP